MNSLACRKVSHGTREVRELANREKANLERPACWSFAIFQGPAIHIAVTAAEQEYFLSRSYCCSVGKADSCDAENFSPRSYV